MDDDEIKKLVINSTFRHQLTQERAKMLLERIILLLKKLWEGSNEKDKI